MLKKIACITLLYSLSLHCARAPKSATEEEKFSEARFNTMLLSLNQQSMSSATTAESKKEDDVDETIPRDLANAIMKIGQPKTAADLHSFLSCSDGRCIYNHRAQKQCAQKSWHMLTLQGAMLKWPDKQYNDTQVADNAQKSYETLILDAYVQQDCAAQKPEMVKRYGQKIANLLAIDLTLLEPRQAYDRFNDGEFTVLLRGDETCSRKFHAIHNKANFYLRSRLN